MYNTKHNMKFSSLVVKLVLVKLISDAIFKIIVNVREIIKILQLLAQLAAVISTTLKRVPIPTVTQLQ